MTVKSILFSDNPPFEQPPGCGPCRQEAEIVLRKNGRLYRFTVRDRISIEDPLMIMVKAAAFAIQNGEPYAAQTPGRAVRDFLIKSHLAT